MVSSQKLLVKSVKCAFECQQSYKTFYLSKEKRGAVLTPNAGQK